MEDNTVVLGYGASKRKTGSEQIVSLIHVQIAIDANSLGVNSVMDKTKAEMELSLSPNPVSNQLRIKFDQPLAGRMEIVDINGSTISSTEVHCLSEHLIDVRAFVNGTYILSFYSEGRSWSSPFIKL